MANAKALACSINRTQELLRDLRRVNHIWRVDTVVAITTGRGRVFAKMFEQDRTPTPRRLHQGCKRIEPRPFAGQAGILNL